LIKMGWGDLETVGGRQGINVTQKKTGLQLWVPFTTALWAAVATWDRAPGPCCARWTASPGPPAASCPRRGNVSGTKTLP
jgi:hypothetical protein